MINGYDHEVEHILEMVRVSEESLAGQGDAVLALIVNRVYPDYMDAISAALASRPADAPPVWALPEDDGLHYPTLAELGRALDAELVAGDDDDLNREVRHVKVAAMSVPNLLDHVEEGTVFIAPGDRPDVIVTAALTRHSGAVPSVAGVVLSGGLRPDQRVADLIGGLGDGGKPLPMLAVDADTFDTANAAAAVEGAITPSNERKVEAALGLFEAHVDLARLDERVSVARSTVVTPLMFQYELIERAKAAAAHIVLPEGPDERILEAADRLVRRKVCELTLLGPESAVRQRMSELGFDLDEVSIVDPATSPWREELRRDVSRAAGAQGRDDRPGQRRRRRCELLRHDDGPRGHRRRDGVGRRTHHGAHDPPGARDHPHEPGHVDRLQRVPDAARRPRAGLRRLRHQP